MNEPPGARARVALTGLTLAEYFRDQEGQDVLFFVDNIFRFTQAGSEMSALLGRIPSAVGRSEEHTSELQSLMRISYAVFCLKQQQTYILMTNYTFPLCISLTFKDK